MAYRGAFCFLAGAMSGQQNYWRQDLSPWESSRREPGGYGPSLGAAGLSHAQVRPGVHRQGDGILSAALTKPADQVAREESPRLGAYYHPRSSICRKVSF